jgi:hypothetical protein
MGGILSAGTITTTSDLSINTRLFVSNDTSLNGNVIIGGNLTVSGNTTFNGNVKFAANSISTDSIAQGINNTFGMFQYQYIAQTLYDLDTTGFLITRYIVNNTETHNVIYSNTDLTINGNITSIYDISANRDLYVAGNIKITGRSTATSFDTESDYRIKANVKSLLDTSFTVDLLQPVTYINKKLNKQDVGFIAHEVQEQYPFLVSGTKDGSNNQSLNYTGIIGILTKEIQELKKENIKLRDKIQNIENYLSTNYSYNN